MINAIAGSGTGFFSVNGAGGSMRPPDPSSLPNEALQPAADKLKMSVSDLKEAMKSGKSPMDLAQSAGIDAKDLMASFKTGFDSILKSNGVGGVEQAGSIGSMPDLAGIIANHKGFSSDQLSAWTSSESSNSNSDFKSHVNKQLSGIAELLNTSTDSLISQLENGNSLADIASKQGVGQNQLLQIVRSGLLTDQSA